MQNMAGYGRNGDTTMGHLTPGETIVPQQVLQQNPQVARGLGRAFTDSGVDPSRYVVGSGQNSINPVTGEREFFLDKVLGAIMGNPSISGALGNLALRKIQGKDVGLRDALLGGLAGRLAGGVGGAMAKGGTGIPFLDNLGQSDMGNAVVSGQSNPFLKALGAAMESGDISKSASNSLMKTFSAMGGNTNSNPIARTEGLLGIGEMLGFDNVDSGIGRFLNTKAGEGIVSGLASQLADSLFSEDEDPDPYGNMARFNRGAGQSPVTLRQRAPRRQTDILYRNEGGPAYFPRRNGGIMPSEGSGTKDDVPAMLTAGEFVMTRDAVEGAGGINNMYSMMDKFERKA